MRSVAREMFGSIICVCGALMNRILHALTGGSAVSETELVKSKLRACGVKPTSQRLEIGAVLLNGPQHVSADQILGSLRNSGSKVSKATVYNTLKLFTQRGLMREVSIDSARQFYDSTTHHHHHFYNVDTGELTDIDPADLAFSRLPSLPCDTEAQEVEVVVRVRNRAE